MSHREGLLDFLRCPECRGVLVPQDDGLLCTGCSHRLPVRGGVPFAFRQGDLPGFLAFDERRGKKARATTPSRHKGGAYHWEAYGFAGLLPDEAGGKVLLHGCGDAGERAPLEERGFDVWGFDVKRTGGTDFLGDAQRLPVADESFDVVLSSQVLEHLPAPWTAAAEVARVLKPGGWFLGSVAFLKPFHKSYFHISHEGIVHLLEPFGLEVDRLQGAQSLAYSLYGGLLPLGGLRLRRAVFGLADRMLMGTRARLWGAMRRASPDSPTDVFDRRFRFSFRAFDKLRFAPAVVFRARKKLPGG